jgi:hypothetical protein
MLRTDVRSANSSSRRPRYRKAEQLRVVSQTWPLTSYLAETLEADQRPEQGPASIHSLRVRPGIFSTLIVAGFSEYMRF